MKFKIPKKKIKYFAIASLGMLLLISGLLYFIVIHRFKESVKYIVKEQTNGKYIFDAGKATVSIWSKSLELERSMLLCKDTTKANSYYNVKLSALKFSLTSWNALIFKNKILVDDLEIINPNIEVFTKKNKNKKTFQPSEILFFLEKMQQSFNLRNLSIMNASFSFKQGNKKPFRIKHVNILLRNFTRVNNDNSHLLGSDHIEFSVGQQSIVSPDGNLNIAFKKINFNSKKQFFNVDSLMLYQQDDLKNARMQFSADQFNFNSRQLGATYQKEELLLDTVRCLNPVITFFDNENVVKKSTTQKGKIKNEIFKLINIKYFEIINASLLQKKADGTLKNMAGKTTNLTVYNLSLHPRKEPKITLDSVRLDMQKIAFFSKDSLHKLTIEEFSFKNNDLIFRHVNYEPTNKQKIKKSMVFYAPSLILKNINIEALLKKKLVADQAEFLKPQIIIDDRQRILGKNVKSKLTTIEKRNNGLYLTFRQVKQLIDVDQLIITQGAISYKGPMKSKIVANASDLNARITLNKMLLSDSLVDIKYSIRKLEIGDVDVKSDKFLLNLRNYKFAGLHRQNWAEQINFHQNKNSISGHQIYWKAFDWDLFQKSKAIQVDSLLINKVVMDLGNDHKKTRTASKKDLPAILISNLGINEVLFKRKSAHQQIRFSGKNILLTNLRSRQNYFIWNESNVHISDFKILGKETNGTIGNIDIKNNVGKVQNIILHSNSEKGDHHIFLPSLLFKGKFNNTQPEVIDLESIVVNNGSMELYAKLQTNSLASKPFEAPKMPIKIKAAAFNNLKIRYTEDGERDSLKFNGTVNLVAQNIESFKKDSPLFKSDDLLLSLLNSNIDNQKYRVTIPRLTLQLKKGNVIHKNGSTTLSSGAFVNWFDVDFKFKKDSMSLLAKGISGRYHEEDFLLSFNEKIDFKKIIDKTKVEGEKVEFKNTSIRAEIQDYKWNFTRDHFQISDFNLLPVVSREMFFKNSKYQDNYLEIKGESASFSIAKLGKLSSDSLFSLNKISLDGLNLIVSTDKNLPRKPAKHKLMPTQLISSLKLPLTIDTISLKNSTVVYKEFEAKTKMWSEIPFSSLNGTIANLSNQKGRKDSLELNMRGKFFNATINRFSYRESYVDSLAGFNANAHFSALDLRDFSNISRPMASVAITSGYSENLYSSWSGNQYAATGNMNFNYNKLKIKFVNPEGKNGWHFSTKMKTFAANMIIPNSRHKSAMMYTERDQNKFIFNYWIKMQVSGFLSTFGLKKNKKYLKKYNENHQQYQLPEMIIPTSNK